MFGRKRELSDDQHPFTDFPFLMVSGLGRSGTTVLRNCIAAHPEINGRNKESNYAYYLMRGANLFMENEFGRSNLAVKESEFWKCHQQLLLNLLWPRTSIRNLKNSKVVATYSKMDPRSAMGMAQAFPKHAICHIVRNGIEVVSSFRAFKNFQHMSFREVCDHWQAQFLMVQYCRDNPHATLIRYEWLENDNQQLVATLTLVLMFLGLEFHDDCLAPLKKRFHPTICQGESRQDSEDLSKRSNRWRFWTGEERTVFTEVCGAAMAEMGYDLPWHDE